MKKLILAAFIMLSSSCLFAQSPTMQKKQVPVPKTPGIIAAAKTPSPVVKKTTHAMVKTTAAPKPMVAKTSPGPATSANTTKTAVIIKKDGTPDKRYNSSKAVKKDGTPDMRYKQNKKS